MNCDNKRNGTVNTGALGCPTHKVVQLDGSSFWVHVADSLLRPSTQNWDAHLYWWPGILHTAGVVCWLTPYWVEEGGLYFTPQMNSTTIRIGGSWVFLDMISREENRLNWISGRWPRLGTSWKLCSQAYRRNLCGKISWGVGLSTAREFRIQENSLLNPSSPYYSLTLVDFRLT